MLFFTTDPISPAGKVNITDLKKIFRDTLIFCSAPISMYLAQLYGTISANQVLFMRDFAPSLVTIGAIEGWALSIAINFILKLKDGTK